MKFRDIQVKGYYTWAGRRFLFGAWYNDIQVKVVKKGANKIQISIFNARIVWVNPSELSRKYIPRVHHITPDYEEKL